VHEIDQNPPESIASLQHFHKPTVAHFFQNLPCAILKTLIILGRITPRIVDYNIIKNIVAQQWSQDFEYLYLSC
jgi:hypothetical protein